MENKHTLQELQTRQAMPLNLKIALTKQRIRDWVSYYGESGVYVSFSGGKDSTVLLDIARKMYPGIKAVFVDTGLEYPEIREFVKSFDNVDWLRPKMIFKDVIKDFGYPIISKDLAQCCFDVTKQAEILSCSKRETPLYKRSFSPDSEYAKKFPTYSLGRRKYEFLLDAPFNLSHRCCDIIKKKPVKLYEKETKRHPILATMACESRLRTTKWLHNGCNAFNVKRPISTPLSFWTTDDCLLYIYLNKLPIASVYGDVVIDYDAMGQVDGQMSFLELDQAELGLHEKERWILKTTGQKRTGCMFCMFGCQFPDWDNFVRMKETHPKQYEYIMKPWEEGGLDYKNVIDWINEHNGKGTIIRY